MSERKVRQAVIMVGGKGTRLLPLTENKPKPMLSVADRPCIWYLVRSLARAGIEEIILACGYQPEKMGALGDGSDLGTRIVYSYEDEPRGTAGAIKLIEGRLDDTFVVANGDIFADIDIASQIRVHQDTDAMLTVLLTPVENPCQFGIARQDADGRITEFKEKPKPEEVFSNLVNAGIYVMEKRVLDYIPEDTFFDLAKDVVRIMMGNGDRIQGYTLEGLWMDVGRPHDLLQANLEVARREHSDDSRDNVVDSRISGAFYAGPQSSVSGSEVASSIVLDRSVVKDSELDNVLVMNGCTVEGARMRNAILGDGCVVKPGAEISDAVLADGTVVGEGEIVKGDRIV